ncbi:unnamed protein product [Rhizophagus irregularis]|nr:unnamed protein product [Rhizophagus irregularis]
MDGFYWMGQDTEFLPRFRLLWIQAIDFGFGSFVNISSGLTIGHGWTCFSDIYWSFVDSQFFEVLTRGISTSI